MFPPSLERRTVLCSGVAMAAALASGLSLAEIADANRLEPVETRALLVRLVMNADGSFRATAFGLDATMRPSESKPMPAIAASSLAAAGKQARRDALQWAESAWHVPASECAWRGKSIVHEASGRSIPAAVWVDFA